MLTRIKKIVYDSFSVLWPLFYQLISCRFQESSVLYLAFTKLSSTVKLEV